MPDLPMPAEFPALTRLLVPMLLLSTFAATQAATLAVRDGALQAEGMIAYDAARSRLVQVGRQGETREFDGQRWLLRPGPGPQMLGGMVERDLAQELVAFGRSYSSTAETWSYDGVRWQQLTPATSPAPRSGFAMAYDSLRDRVVVFGGAGVVALQCDTWEWDGSNWTQRATTGPTACVNAGMAFDRARGVCVLFGSANVGAPAQTWEWNGQLWQQRFPVTSPVGRIDHAMAYDELRARVVVVGGFDSASLGLNDQIWEYDGTTWTQRPTVGGPGPIYEQDLVYARDRGQVLMSGGLVSSAPQGDVWGLAPTGWQVVASTPFVPRAIQPGNAVSEPLQGGVLVSGGIFGHSDALFVGDTWTRPPSAVQPPGRQGAASWSDGSNAWMFGGSSTFPSASFDDLWRWTASGWQAQVVPVRPSSRSYARAAYDSARGEAVLFGGGGSIWSGPWLAETWTFAGTWTQRFPTVQPSARSLHGMAYDPLRDRVVLFGGTGSTGPKNDTWEWNGTTWTQIAIAAPPPLHGSVSMAFDPRTSRIVLATTPISQSLVGTLVEIWEYDGVAWTRLPIDELRVVGRYHWLLNDPLGNRLLLIDGETAQELVYQPASVGAFGSACGVGAPRLAARTRALLGEPGFGVDVVGAPPSWFVLLGGSLAQTTLPLAGCTLLLDAPQVTALVPTNASGFATQVIPVPPTASLQGTTVFFQGATLTAAGFLTTAGLRTVIGR